jgi:hypothetical protein
MSHLFGLGSAEMCVEKEREIFPKTRKEAKERVHKVVAFLVDKDV